MGKIKRLIDKDILDTSINDLNAYKMNGPGHPLIDFIKFKTQKHKFTKIIFLFHVFAGMFVRSYLRNVGHFLLWLWSTSWNERLQTMFIYLIFNLTKEIDSFTLVEWSPTARNVYKHLKVITHFLRSQEIENYMFSSGCVKQL